MIPTIETDRLIIRGPDASDFGSYQRFFSDADASGLYGGPLPPNLAFRKLAADIGHWHIRGYGMWNMVERSSGKMVGSCGLVWPEGWPRSELTWWIAADARRQGFAYEGSRAVISFAYGELKWSMVETHMNDENEAARNLALKLGGQIIARETFPDEVERNIYALPQ